MQPTAGIVNFIKQGGQVLQVGCLLAGVMVLLSLGPWKHPFLDLSARLVAFLAALWCLLASILRRQYIAAIIFLAIMLYLNPVYPWQVKGWGHDGLCLAAALLFFLFVDRGNFNREQLLMDLGGDEQTLWQTQYRDLIEMRQRVELEFNLARAERRRAQSLLQQAQSQYRRVHGHAAPFKEEAVLEGDPYQTLGVVDSDSLDDIRDIYHKLAQIYHPDHYTGTSARTRSQRARKMAAINDAFQWVKKNHR